MSKIHEQNKKKSKPATSIKKSKGKSRAKPAVKGTGDFYHIVVRPKEQFKTFRTQVLGEENHSERVAGLKNNGRWATQKWLINKEDAYINSRGYLKSNREKTQQILNRLGSVPRHVEGDLFKAKPRSKIPKKDKPTAAQKKARSENIKKARKAKKTTE